MDHASAALACTALGPAWGLCTQAQLATQACCNTGCSYNRYYAWTGDDASSSALYYVLAAQIEVLQAPGALLMREQDGVQPCAGDGNGSSSRGELGAGYQWDPGVGG